LPKNNCLLNITRYLVCVLMATQLASCISSGGPNKKSKTTTNSTKPNSPVFESTDYVRFVYHDTNYNAVLPISVSMIDTIYLQGKSVHNFIDNGNASTVLCLVTHYETTMVSNKILISALRPANFLNQNSNTRENYFFFSPSDTTANQYFCKKTGLINAMNIKYPGHNIAYSPSEMQMISTTSITSNYFAIHAEGGSIITQMEVNHLSLKINAGPDPTDQNTFSCVTTTECKNKGYDCCSMNQCIKDNTLKDGVNTSSNEYIQAILDIQQNQATFKDYPNFFHVCGNEVEATPTPTPTVNPEEENTLWLQKLKHLYECTTPLEGEMSICTVTHPNAQTGVFYSTTNDDRNFRTTLPADSLMPTHSVVEIIYAGTTLFTKGEIYNPTNGKYTIGQGNDTLIDPVVVSLTNVQPGSNPPDLDLLLRYKVDGSCEQINSMISKCKKYYIQGQNSNPTRVDDHPTGTDLFYLPSYADISKSVVVEVDGITKIRNIHWQLINSSPAHIQFIGTGQQVFDTQSVIITYYVSNSTLSNVLQAKQTALEEIDKMCNCGGKNNCSLTPVITTNLGVESISNYKCVYPENNSLPVPLQQIVYLNPKTVPVRLFDKQGVSKKEATYEVSQEGSLFKYYKDNLLKPNNLFDVSGNYKDDIYIGFNEIYGSLSYLTDSAKPALEIRVVKNKTYDIFVDAGVFSSCYFCGSDYYSNLAKLFPSNFSTWGGGYTPDPSQTSRIKTNVHRADDSHFGRSCYVPATMIPWSHRASSDRQEQRQRRLATQHFLFANGYNRDWYGFDYGSVIGSFDGVKWFAIGNERRIRAEGNKLFLAVNAYFGDLTLANQVPFQVTVQDSITTINTGELISSDFENAGAECQKYHVCNTDKDCVTQLGWNYACETISGISTSWPIFDENALELPDQSQTIMLTQIIKNLTGGSKRCVYRGRGAPCHTNYHSIFNSSTGGTVSYDGTKTIGLHSCVPNSYCQNFRNTVEEEKFNNKIARFGKTVKNVNNDTTNPMDDVHEFGLGAPIIGRPLKYFGDTTIPYDVEGNLTSNNLVSLCLPGRDPSIRTLVDSHRAVPGLEFSGDQVLEIGITPSSSTAASNYLSSCSILDKSGNYYYKTTSHYTGTIPSLNNATLVALSGGQALPTNALKTFEATNMTGNENIVKDFTLESIKSITLEENRCLRSPGSSCHTDLDCAPSWYMANKLSGITAADYASILNKYEVEFWQQELVCSQEYDPENSLFKLTNNRCCRKTNQPLSIGTLHGDAGSTDPTGTNFDPSGIPGIVANLDNFTRYSRMSTIYHEMQTEPNKYPVLSTAVINQCSSSSCMDKENLKNQFFTFSKTAEKTCCSGHFIRNFHTDNGGGHNWSYSKMQSINKSSFNCYNWSVCLGSTCGDDFTCDHTDLPDDANCRMYSTRDSQAGKIFDWLGTLELTGIPQVMIKSRTHPDILCRVNPEDQTLPGTTPPPGIITTSANAEEYQDASNPALRYLSSLDKNNFDSNLKPIFSPDSVSCCIAAGEKVEVGTDKNICCTGYINPQTNRCALPDFANVSVYLNRYVSSHAKGLNDSSFDEYTGYIKDLSVVKTLGCKICASSKLATGITLNKFKVPGHENNSYEIKRFLSSNNAKTDNYIGLAGLYDAGLRWNTHVYCYPEDGGENPAYLSVIECE